MDLQWDAGINGVLIAGTMGLLQLLREPTYISLIEQSTRLCNGRGEILIGVGDAGFAGLPIESRLQIVIGSTGLSFCRLILFVLVRTN